MKKLIFTTLTVCLAFILQAQQISNVTATQTGNTVEILYNMNGFNSPQNIQILCSTDGGNSFTIPLRSVSGDIGAQVMPGGTKKVIWNVLSDVQSLHTGSAVFKVIASGNGGNSSGSSGFSMEFEGATMNIYEVKRTGQTIRFNFKLTAPNKDLEANMRKNDLRMIDNDGNVYDNEIKITLGSHENSGWVRQQLVKGIPMKGSLIFQGIPTNVKNIALLEVKLNRTKTQKRNIIVP